MQVLLAVAHTIFKIDDTIDDYKRFLKFLHLHFNVKSIKENQFFVPRTVACTQQRKQLMKWLYSFYKKDAKNFNESLKYELLQRIDKPIHIHFLASANQTKPPRQTLSISATFYEENICQLLVSQKNESMRRYILEYFKGLVSEKSVTLSLYELQLPRLAEKYKLKDFFQKRKIDGIPVLMLFNTRAFNSFLLANKEVKITTELESACNILNVSKFDSFETVKRHYKKLAKAYHPDISALSSSVSTKKFQTLSHAFDIIKRYKTVA